VVRAVLVTSSTSPVSASAMAPTEEKDVEMNKEEAKEAEQEKTTEKPEEAKASEEKPKEPEPPKELEEDATEIKGAKVKGVALNFGESTLNVMPMAGGRILRTLSEGGMQHLLASIRSNTGVKSGRYMFEIRLVELLSPDQKGESRLPAQVVRVGFALSGSSIFLADGSSSVCFDSEGFFVHDKARKKAGTKFTRDQTVAVLLNMDASSANKNTVSLFIDGARASPPQALPEELCGKTLFPTITYKNVSLEVNLGPIPRRSLPFTCHMVAGAAAADVEVVKSKAGAAGGKHEVVFPVGLPDQGYFDWVDGYLEKNPGFIELSDRKIIEWLTKSGVWRPKGGAPGSNDKPEAKYGVSVLDDWSIRKVLSAICPALPRNFVVPELKANLVATGREAALLRFQSQDFTRKAVVLVGEPDQEYKDRVLSLLLAEKRAKAEAEQKRKAQEEERKRLLELKKRKAEEARKAKEAAQRKKEGATDAQEEEPKAEAAEESKEDEVKAEEPAPVELSDEEKKVCHRKLALPDLTERVLSTFYTKFSLPTKAEGFDDVSFVWQKEADAVTILQKWVLEKKLTQRAEDLQPGTDFKEAWAKWQKTLQEWRRRQGEWKDPAKRKAAAAKKAAEKKKKLEEEKKKLIEAGDEDAAKALEEAAKKEEDAAPMEIELEELDVFSVSDVSDLGNGMPLFANFTFEDWTMLSLRYEFHLLLHSFKKDLDDPDRPGFGEKHLGFYYQRYFKKTWNFGQYNIPKFDYFIELMKDTVKLDGSFLKAEQPEDTPAETFVKFAEEHRKERERRVDAGDETAKLRFNRPAAPQPRQPAAPQVHGNGRNTAPAGPVRTSAAQKRPYSASPTTSYSQPAKQARTTSSVYKPAVPYKGSVYSRR